MEQPLIKIEEKSGELLLTIQDTEIFDFIEDLLIEKYGLKYTYLETVEINGIITYSLHFPENTNQNLLQTAIDSIDQNELRRIWNLNH